MPLYKSSPRERYRTAGSPVSRWARKTAKAAVLIGGILAFLIFVLLGALSLAAVRSFAVAQVNQALDGAILGKLHVEHVARIGLTGADGVNATVLDPSGRVVLIVRGASARLSIAPLVWAVLVHPHASLPIDIGWVTADHAEVQLIDDGFDVPTLAAAFAPLHPNVGTSHAALPTLHIRSIDIHHAWVHGQLGSAPAIDADIGHAHAKLELVAARLGLQIDRADVRTRGLPYQVDPQGETGGTMELPVVAQLPAGKIGESRAPGLVVHAWYSGKFAGSSIAATFDWVEDKLSASFDGQRIESASLARVVPGAHLLHPLSLHATAEGTLSDIYFDARLLVDKEWTWAPALTTAPATLVVNGHAAFDDTLAIDAEIRAEDVDLAALFADSPESRLGARVHMTIARSPSGAISGRYAASSPSGSIAGTLLPALDLEGDLRRNANGPVTAKGQIRILEPGAHTSIDYLASLGTKPSESVVSFESKTELADPKRLRSLADGLHARGMLGVSARYWPDDSHWTAQTHARLYDVRHALFNAAEVDVRAKAEGGRHPPFGVVHIRARDIRAAGQSLRRLDVDAEGNLAQARLSANLERDDAQRCALTTELGFRPNLRAQNTHLVLVAREGAVTFAVHEIRSSKGQTSIDGLRIEGAGTLDASFTFGSRIEQLDLTTKSFDGARLARLLVLHSPFRTGRATLGARYVNRGATAEGFVRGRVAELGFGSIQRASVEVNLTLARSKIDGTLAAKLAPGSVVSVSARAIPLSIVERPDLALESREFSFSVHSAMDSADLRPWFGALGLPLDHASGVIRLDLTASGPSDGREYPRSWPGSRQTR